MIELTNLMKGDYVLCNGKVCRVKEVGGMACVATIDDEEELFCNAEDIETIPLTAEILAKNFPTIESGVGWFPEEEHFHCDTSYSEGDILVSGMFKWVHQLQHALRLAKIEKEIEL